MKIMILLIVATLPLLIQAQAKEGWDVVQQLLDRSPQEEQFSPLADPEPYTDFDDEFLAAFPEYATSFSLGSPGIQQIISTAFRPSTTAPSAVVPATVVPMTAAPIVPAPVVPPPVVPATVVPAVVAPLTAAPVPVLPATVTPLAVAPLTVAPVPVVPATVGSATVAPLTAAPVPVVPATVTPLAVLPATVTPLAVAPLTVAPVPVVPATIAPVPIVPAPIVPVTAAPVVPMPAPTVPAVLVETPISNTLPSGVVLPNTLPPLTDPPVQITPSQVTPAPVDNSALESSGADDGSSSSSSATSIPSSESTGSDPPSMTPTVEPTSSVEPTNKISFSPSMQPTITEQPTGKPSKEPTNMPTSSISPSSAPTTSAAPSPFYPELVKAGDNWSPLEAFPLLECQGDCDDDDECDWGLICYQRSGYDPVPFCRGGGQRSKDYCINPGPGTLVIYGEQGFPYDHYPLPECNGMCYDDDQCIGDLKCVINPVNRTVPGCIGQASSDTGYCYNVTNDVDGLYSNSTRRLEGNASSKPNPFKRLNQPPILHKCEGRCMDDKHCDGDLKCMTITSADQRVLGCKGIPEIGNAYCYDPDHMQE